MMTAAKIKEYLGMCKSLEEEIYAQDQIIASINYRIGQLGKEKCYMVPQKSIVESESTTFTIFLGIGIFFLSLWLMDVIGWLLGFFCGLGMAVGVIIILLGIMCCVTDAETQRENDKKYEAEMSAYDRSVKNDKCRVRDELAQKEYLRREVNRLLAANRQTKGALRELYNKNVIHSNYRGLIPVCSLYGYFDTGVCTQLEGHEGAYNKYDTESRLDRIIVKLDEVIRNLEEIKQNQWVLYDTIQESNQKADQLLRNCARMANQLKGIQSQDAELNARIARLQSTSDLNLYVNACAKRELEYINRADRIF